MANIIPLKEESGAQFYPQTHEKAVIDSNGVNLQTKLANITTPSYVTAWDGASTPVVANIPAGVVVTYNSTDYTGALAASASTLNKTYLVATGTANNYYRYVTELSGSSYSWHSIGTTEINLSDYATKEELSQLSQLQTQLSAAILESAYFTQSSPTIVSYSRGFKVHYYPVKQGDKLKVTASEAQNRAFNYGFTTVVPAANVSVTNATSVSTSSIDLDLTASADGYFVFAKYQNYFTNIVVTLLEGTIDTIRELQGDVESLGQSLNGKIDKEEGKTLISQDVADRVFLEGQEYLRVELDNENKILGGRDLDGRAFEKVGFDTPNISVDGKEDSTLEDPEGRMEIKTDAEGKIISYREEDGRLVENVGIKAKEISFIDDAELKGFRADINKVYDTVTDAVEQKHLGQFQVGENIVIGMKALESPYTVADIEKNYRNILPNPVFPYIKKSSIHRLYDDAATPNMLYICSHSDKHIFYSICPTDTKRAFGNIDPDYYNKYNANYFYYADKDNPSDIHKVILPATVNGVSMNRQISFVLEMSNGDCLVEIGNGSPVGSSTTLFHKNIYKVSGVFSGNTIAESDVTLSLSFDKYLEKVSSFDNAVEYKAGCIILAPYSGTATGKVYISKDYGDSWDLIFCMDATNATHFIAPKAAKYGDADGYGVWPTSADINPEGALDWDTSINGNYHIHGIAYDPWYDRIWVVTGDGDGQLAHNITGIWWTDDEGYTWKRIGGGKEIHTQLIGVIPMEHCVLFPTDGGGNGIWRWSRNGKDSIIKIEEVYNYLGFHGNTLLAVGQRSIRSKTGFYLNTFAPNNYTDSYRGGVVATPNGYDFQKIFEDIYTEFSADTVEIGWGCDITDCGDKLILSAYQGGYIELNY